MKLRMEVHKREEKKKYNPVYVHFVFLHNKLQHLAV